MYPATLKKLGGGGGGVSIKNGNLHISFI